MAPPLALTVAGSDSSGSSGIQADLPTFAALGAHATSVVTVVTAQNSLGVDAFHPLPDDLVAGQLESVLADLAPTATKTGLLLRLAAVELIEVNVSRLGILVVDPVLVDSAGALIVEPGVVEAYRRLARTAIAITPNRTELELLLGQGTSVDTVEAVVAHAEAIRSLGARMVVVTGGRGARPDVTDVVITETDISCLRSPRVDERPIRGTGCTYAAALTALLASGAELGAAALGAHDFVQRQLREASALQLGRGLPGVPHQWVDPNESE